MSELPARTTVGAPKALIRPDRREVVVGIESSGDNRVVVEWAAREAVARNAPLTLVHTWEWEGVPVWATPYHYARKKDIAREGEQILARAKKCAIEAGARDVEVVTQRGYAPDVLVAMTAQASMLVVGNRHASAVARGVFGSVSTAVVSEARCPVIVLSGEPDRTEVPDVTGDGSEVVVGLTGGPHDQNVLGFGFDFAREHALTLRAVFCWDAMFGISCPSASGHGETAARREHGRLARVVSGGRDRLSSCVTVRRSRCSSSCRTRGRCSSSAATHRGNGSAPSSGRRCWASCITRGAPSR